MVIMIIILLRRLSPPARMGRRRMPRLRLNED
jgi:hypothetical protein